MQSQYNFIRASVLISLTACFLQNAPGQAVVVDAIAFAKIAPSPVKIEKLAGDMSFTEGPVWIEATKSLVFSDIPASKLMRWSQENKLSVLRPSEAANGNTLDAEGRLITCQHAARNIVRTEKDGAITVLADRFEGKRLNSPNDAAVHKDGSIWFTDPHYGLRSKEDREQTANRVYRLDPKTGTVTAVSEEFEMPNGLAFSPDFSRLYIADSGKPQRVGVFEVKPGGTLSPAIRWLEGGSDGLRVDKAGNLYTTAGDGVRIYDLEGKKIATLTIPEPPANCGFGGDGFKTLFITARTSLYSIRLNIPGARLE